MDKSNELLSTLKELFPNAGCELHYRNLFELLIAVSLSAQTTDKRVNQVTSALFSHYPTSKELSKAKEEEIYPYIQSLGLAKTKSKHIIALSKKLEEEFSGQIPSTREKLMSLPGVGRKTANVILSVGFKEPAIAVDTHIARVANRLGLACSTDVLEIEQSLMKQFQEKDWCDVHHLLLFFGRYLCKAQRPECDRCPFVEQCKKS